MAHRFVMRDIVQFSETDMAGIVHFSNFFRFMERTEHAFFRSLGLATRLHELQIGQDTIDEIVRRFNERGSRLGEAGNITGDVTRRILELCK